MSVIDLFAKRDALQREIDVVDAELKAARRRYADANGLRVLPPMSVFRRNAA